MIVPDAGAAPHHPAASSDLPASELVPAIGRPVTGPLIEAGHRLSVPAALRAHWGSWPGRSSSKAPRGRFR